MACSKTAASILMVIAAMGVSVQRCSMAAENDEGQILEVRKIWDEAPHNAFTDLIRHEGLWYCVFREGATHVSPDGKLRVITSENGGDWSPRALIELPGADLRDAKITIAPDGRLMLCGAAATGDQKSKRHQSYVWYSSDGQDWGEAIAIGEPNYWIWRITWHQGIAYGIGYGTGGAGDTRLYRSVDGRNFEVLVAKLVEGNFPNESSLVFDQDGTAMCLLRREGPEDPAALFGSSQPPYTQWDWQSLDVRVGGPQLVQLPNGRLLAAGRKYDGGAATRLWWLDPKVPSLTPIVTLPSGGDTSYPGLVFHEGLLWVSYYSSHEGKSSIYLAEVQLPHNEP